MSAPLDHVRRGQTPTVRQIKLEQELLRLEKLEAEMRRVAADVAELKR